MKAKPGILYISYDGMLEPLGYSQVLGYLKLLAPGREIHLISYEKKQDWDNQAERARLAAEIAAAGIRWHPLRYHKAPTAVATSWDIAIGTLTGLFLVLRHRLAIVHARSYVASVVALAIKRVTRVRYLFDMRGFWADERVDVQLWSRTGRLYRVAKWFERQFLLHADHVVSLTHAGVRELRKFPYLSEKMPPVTVISTCADLRHFRVLPRNDASPFVLGYVGSAGTWYDFDAAVVAFVELKRLRPDARFLILNRGEHAFIRERLQAAGVREEDFELFSARHEEIPAQMARMTAGVFFIKPVFSKQASAPTKLGEFLGCGVPCLANHGVGDMAAILEESHVGIAVANLGPEAVKAGVSALLELVHSPMLPERCVRVAHENFALEKGVERYADVYTDMLMPR